MNVAAAQCQPIVVALILILRVEAGIGEFVGLRERPGRSRCEARIEPWMNVEVHPERADHERMAAPLRLEGYAPIRRSSLEQPGRAEGIGTQALLRVEVERAVARHFQIKLVVDEGISADPAHMRGKSALDQGFGPGCRRNRRRDIREGPGRRGVPYVLDRWIVVGRDAVDNVKGADGG